MAKVEHIKKLKTLIEKYKLDAPESFWESSDEQLAEIYNGAGPDQLGKYGRAKLTKFLEMFEAAFLIHDFEFENSDDSKAGLALANERMWKNMCKLVFGLCNWRNYTQWGKIAAYLALALGAYQACTWLGYLFW